jgi:hypothetical protein
LKKSERERKEYFQSITRHFLKLRGAPLFLSSKEFDLISRWEEMEIPLPVVLEGIDRAFESFKAKPGQKAKIQALAFCELQVLRAFEQHRERKVGGRKKGLARDEKREQAKREVQKFLKTLAPPINYLKEAYSRGQEILSQRQIDEDELERIEAEIEALLWKNSSEEEKNRVRRELSQEFEFKDEDEFMTIFKIKLVKFLRDRYKIPYISLYYY